MWHGSKQDRNYIGRIELMKDYNPREDVKVSKDGCWEWATEKPQLHKAIENYMKSRTKG